MDKIDKLIIKYKDQISDLQDDLFNNILLSHHQIKYKQIRIEILESVISDLYELN